MGIGKSGRPVVCIGLQRKVSPAIAVHVIADFLWRAGKRDIGERQGF